ncbi:MAG: NADH-quinone oxidoreductase subunit C [Elusimicrobia bacterium]|nr:NADH-quinone oxidoreductase subunit C [Elusimicrobiota bacterium]MBU2614416.1 NADH-quinone oxidoreductase subunit C [Elusimicrobiota bacterium]
MESIAEKVKEKFGSETVKYFEKNAKRHYFDVDAGSIVKLTKILFHGMGFRFITATGIHIRSGFEILYHFSYDKTGEVVTLRVFLNEKEKPEIDSITPLFVGAEWIEREMCEMLGINFRNHPNLKKLLLDSSWPDGKYPLRQTE